MIDEEKLILKFVDSHKKLVGKDIRDYCKKIETDSNVIWKNYFDKTAPEPHLFSNIAGFWGLTPEGKRRLEEKSFWNKHKTSISFIANLIMTFAVGIAVTFYSTSYANSLAVSLEEKYNPSLRLTPQSLNITMYDYFKEISAARLTEMDYFNNRPKVEICIKNFAKMKTDYIHFILIDDNLTSNDGNIQNIDSMNSACVYVNLRHKDCYSDNCPVNRYSIPNGTVPLTFEFNCKNCETQIFPYTFNDICIFRESSLECKK